LNVKIYKPKKEKIMFLVLRIILWLCIVVIAFRGVSSIIRGSSNILIKRSLENGLKEDLKKERKEKEAVEFAKNFLVEYLTFNGDKEEYLNRLKPFSSLQFEGSLKTSDVIYVNSIKSEWINKNLILIDCKVKVNTLTNDSVSLKESVVKNIPNLAPVTPSMVTSIIKLPTPTPVYTTKPVIMTKEPTPLPTQTISPNIEETDLQNSLVKTSITYMRVAIKVKANENFSVISYPLIISNKKNEVKESEENLPGEALEDGAEISNIKKTIKSFLESYYKGSNDLGFFLEDTKQSDINKLDGAFKIDSFEDIQVNKYKKEYYVRANYTIKSEISTLKQSFDFICIFKNDRYLIQKFNLKLF
jgi:hypothetical protein